MSDPVICVVGSLNFDLITRTTRIPGPGETLKAESFSTGCGGKGANQAVACSRLSRRKDEPSDITIKMVGIVGDDLYGEKMKSTLQSSGVDVQNVMTDPTGTSTGTAVIIVEEQTGENRILITAGANSCLTAGKLFPCLHGAPPSLFVLQLEIPLDTVLTIISYAKENRVPVLLNPAPAMKLPEKIYEGLTHLILNESEAAFLAPQYQDVMEQLEHFCELGVQHVTITLGAKGACWRSGWDIEAPGMEGTFGCNPAPRVAHVVDTTGAGDTFVGAYAVAIAKQYSVSDAVSWANEAAAKTVQKKGAQDSIPWMDEVPPLPEYSDDE
ncbi:MAG: hypothetical protein Q9222_006632 [Ikaeria aurantiellina]